MTSKLDTAGLVERLQEAACWDDSPSELLNEAASQLSAIQERAERAERDLLGAHAVIDAQKQKLDGLVSGDKSDVAHAYQLRLNAAEARVAELEQEVKALRQRAWGRARRK